LKKNIFDQEVEASITFNLSINLSIKKKSFLSWLILMSSDSGRGLRWCFTINNPQEVDKPVYIDAMVF
jgi:hypothetical protein